MASKSSGSLGNTEYSDLLENLDKFTGELRNIYFAHMNQNNIEIWNLREELKQAHGYIQDLEDVISGYKQQEQSDRS